MTPSGLHSGKISLVALGGREHPRQEWRQGDQFLGYCKSREGLNQGRGEDLSHNEKRNCVALVMIGHGG